MKKDFLQNDVDNCPTPVSYTHLDVYKRQEINYAIIKNDSGEDINSNLQEEKKSFSITTKDVIVLAIIGIMIVICLIILEINIMKRKNN